MASDKESSQRRVYVLPNELVERIVAYQTEMGIQSEVEAARRLLDEALKTRDDWRSIAQRFKERLSETRVLAEIAKDVLIGHPLVKGISFDPGSITFELMSGESVSVSSTGSVMAWDSDRNSMDFEPKRRRVSTIDDDVPF